MQRSLVLDTNSIVYMGTWTLLASPYALLICYKFLVGRDKNILLYSWHGIASTCTMHTVCLVDCNSLVSHSHFLFVRIKYMYYVICSNYVLVGGALEAYGRLQHTYNMTISSISIL